MEVSKSLCYVEPTERVTRIEPFCCLVKDVYIWVFVLVKLSLT